MSLEELKKDCSKKQKKGIHFIIASIIIWSMVLIVQITNLPILTKNLLTFCCTAPLLPISFLISKILKIQFQDKSNPLNNTLIKKGQINLNYDSFALNATTFVKNVK